MRVPRIPRNTINGLHPKKRNMTLVRGFRELIASLGFILLRNHPAPLNNGHDIPVFPTPNLETATVVSRSVLTLSHHSLYSFTFSLSLPSPFISQSPFSILRSLSLPLFLLFLFLLTSPSLSSISPSLSPSPFPQCRYHNKYRPLVVSQNIRQQLFLAQQYKFLYSQTEGDWGRR